MVFSLVIARDVSTFRVLFIFIDAFALAFAPLRP